MKRSIAIGLAVALLASIPAAQAQQAQQADRRAALAERYVELSIVGLEKTVRDGIARQMEEHGSAMPEAHAQWFRVNAPTILLPHLQRMIEAMKRDYAERFTEQELAALVAFYEAPMGRAIARKQMDMGVEEGQRMAAFEAAFMNDLLTKYCGAFDCEAMAREAAGAAKPPKR
ncbi:DUF2059 domain-containing protein [Brevundimonas naejangsanensis]|uniref:DUF2059 domain-containing protein n=1 Tax=Brevundimonas naejangsanensis TaxID=588932 RepID=UPI001069849D|nr:DUF2059 domain-containing protein [Brevundimonas naejangsanensis]QBQ47647.1 DUF2059 domain-containing protein [Brevundimonas naejangsanensis]